MSPELVWQCLSAQQTALHNSHAFSTRSAAAVDLQPSVKAMEHAVRELIQGTGLSV